MNTEENKNEIIKEQIKIETNQDNDESSFKIDKEEIFKRKIRSLPVNIANFNLENYRKRSESSSDILDNIEIINKAEKKKMIMIISFMNIAVKMFQKRRG